MNLRRRAVLVDTWWTRIVRRLVIDVALFALATELSVFIRFDLRTAPHYEYLLSRAGVAEMMLLVAVELALRVPLAAWHFASLYDVTRLLSATVLTKAVGMFLVKSLLGPQVFSRGAYLISAVLAFLFLVGARVVVRVLYERHSGRLVAGNRNGRPAAPRVIIVGAGETGEKLLREYESRKSLGRVVGLLDDDRRKLNDTIRGRPVLGTIEDAPDVVLRHHVDELVIAIPSAKAQVTRRLLTLVADQPVTVKTLPALWEVADGSVLVEQLRQVRLEDLLVRTPVSTELGPVRAYVEGKRVLVTGGGGSIGAEIVRQVARLNPSQLVMLGRGENRIFRIDRELQEFEGVTCAVPVIGDVRDEARMSWLFDTYQPEIILHAAAHKHVPLMEQNPEEAILNNVGGTRTLLKLAVSQGVERFVNISTDKAVNPVNFMGASKRVAELIVQANDGNGRLRATSVRFGNVLGSKGSVAEVFQKQLEETRTLRVTDPNMERFFMLIPEAVQLVLQAGALTQGRDIFVLQMGEPIRILDLARSYIKLAGLEVGHDASIIITGNRGNEKMTEELWSSAEHPVATDYASIMRVECPECPDVAALHRAVDALLDAARSHDAGAMRTALHAIDPSINIPL